MLKTFYYFLLQIKISASATSSAIKWKSSAIAAKTIGKSTDLKPLKVVHSSSSEDIIQKIESQPENN